MTWLDLEVKGQGPSRSLKWQRLERQSLSCSLYGAS